MNETDGGGTPTPAALFSPEETAEMWARVEEWREGLELPEGATGNQKLADWAEKQVLFQAQVNAALASGAKLFPGNTGVTILARAIKDFQVTAERVLRIIMDRERTIAATTTARRR